MLLKLPSPFITPCLHLDHVKVPLMAAIPQTSLFHPICGPFHYNVPQKRSFVIKQLKSPMEFIAREHMDSELIEDGDLGLAADSPWEGAILYQRNPSISHVEYCTTLERLGLGNLSTQVSKSRASSMGLRVTKMVKDFPDGTPVLISIDVTRKKKHKLRLDGIIRTVITLGCNRCGGPAADCIFSDFSLILTEEPIEEPEIINVGVIYGQNKFKSSSSIEEDQEEDDEASIDLDDWLYFPPEEKVIDISKNVRDILHLEIRINAVCDPMCKGMCLKCGQNLNTSNCSCSNQSMNMKSYGPLGGLKQQMKQ